MIPKQFVPIVLRLQDAEIGVLVRSLLTGAPLPETATDVLVLLYSVLMPEYRKKMHLSEMRSTFGKMGAKAKQNAKQNASKSISKTQAKKDEINNSHNIVIDNKETQEGNYTPTKSELIITQDVIDFWQINGLREDKDCTALAPIVIKAIRKYGTGDIADTIKIAAQSEYLKGNKGGWCATLEWFCRPQNYEKVKAHYYDDNNYKTSRSNGNTRNNQTTDFDALITGGAKLAAVNS